MSVREHSEPYNSAVHSASRPDASNSRMVLAEFRFMRHHIVVVFDHADSVYRYEQFEHNKPIDKRSARETEMGLLEKFAHAVEKICKDFHHHRRFAKPRGVNMHHLPKEGAPNIRRFDPTKVPKRSVFDRYPQYDPAKGWPDDEETP